MARVKQLTRHDKILKQVNADARQKTNDRGKKAQEDLDKSTTQTRL